ncbi:zinc finger, CCHC-type containing protein [Tanacetum coccineum]|uniref:Zinc finger, CCHC-type containing protein n=1 Tax=Tanacetum coccineum TaxID=301880 RepID=A0ABQ5G7R7_9ASTR
MCTQKVNEIGLLTCVMKICARTLAIVIVVGVLKTKMNFPYRSDLDDYTCSNCEEFDFHELTTLMLVCMTLDLQKNLQHCGAYDMQHELKTMSPQQANQELLDTVKAFHACKQEEGKTFTSYLLKMKGYIDHQECLENQLENTIKALRSDLGGEYMSYEFLEHLMKCGIISHFTVPYMPQMECVKEEIELCLT